MRTPPIEINMIGEAMFLVPRSGSKRIVRRSVAMRRDDHRSEIARSIARPSQGEGRPETGRPFSLSTHVPSAELNAPASYLMVYFTSGRRLTCKRVPLNGRMDTPIAVV